MIKRYLIKQWHAHRGSTEENPAYYSGLGSTVFHTLENIDPDYCYKSLKQAERAAARWRSIYTQNTVIEVPASAFI